jgi:hypothetical protein
VHDDPVVQDLDLPALHRRRRQLFEGVDYDDRARSGVIAELTPDPGTYTIFTARPFG